MFIGMNCGLWETNMGSTGDGELVMNNFRVS